MKTIPVIQVAAAPATSARRTVAPPARTAAEPYRAYKPRPFTRAERERRHGALRRAALARRAHRTRRRWRTSATRCEVLPTATREDLLTGREVADIGQCSPTSFTTGNLANFLRAKASEIGAEEVAKKYVYVTFGSCGACRFGQYHQSYELALRNVGLESFRMFLLRAGRPATRADGRRRARVQPAVHARPGLGDRAERRRAGLRVSDAAVRGEAGGDGARGAGVRRVSLRRLPQDAGRAARRGARWPGTSRPTTSPARCARCGGASSASRSIACASSRW